MTRRLIVFLAGLSLAGGAGALQWAPAVAASVAGCGLCSLPIQAAGRLAESCESHCTRFSACSIERNLAYATGPELERYRDEKAEDGRDYADWRAPALELPALDGGQVSLADHRGRPIALVTLAVHCKHSYDTLPILEQLQRRHAASGVAILAVYVNSGSVSDVRESTGGMDLALPIAVDPRAELAPLLHSRMVPSVFLIDAQGRIRRKLVGFKDHAHPRSRDRVAEEAVAGHGADEGFSVHRACPTAAPSR